MSTEHPSGNGRPKWKLRVLVVEDDADTAATLGRLLLEFGFEVRVEIDAAAALRWARAHHPDVVLLDIGLPGGMDGYELARRLRDEPAPKPPLFVTITGRADAESLRRSEEAGIHLHLVKPVEPDEVHALLRRFERVIMPSEH